MFSRRAYVALKVETTENTPVTPDQFFGVTALDIVTQYKYQASNPVLADRNLRVHPVKGEIQAPQGHLTIQIEPKKFPNFMKAVFGALSSGVYFATSSVSGTFVVGETVTGGTSAATATVVAVSKEKDYLLVTIASGTFTAAGEAITGGTSGATATLGVNAATVYGHEAKAPQNSLQTYTLEVGYENEAIRYTGVRFPAINSLAPKNNILTAEVAVFARAAFVCARVTAAVTAGSNKAIPVDQTQGLNTSDTIKVFRPSTGVFKDLSASSVKTSPISSISAGVSVTIGTLTDALAVGDLLVLAPQTASYTVGKELPWIGGSVARLGDTLTAAIAASGASVEDFEVMVVNEMEDRHAANAATMAGRFPTTNHLKGLHVEGSLKQAYADVSLIGRMRDATETALQVVTQGAAIGSTNLYNTVDVRISRFVFEPFNPAIADDALLDLAMPFQAYKDDTSGFTAKMLAVNDVASYS